MAERVDVCIIGVGAAGGIIAQELCKAGLQVVGLDAGPWYKEPGKDFKNSEVEMLKLIWDQQQYTSSGNAYKGSPQFGFGVGGGTLHWTAASWRFFPEDFRVKSIDGAPAGTSVEDWPISYEELAPYYEKAEKEMGVAGRPYPWGAPRGDFPMPPHGYFGTSLILKRGCDALGIRTAPGPVAINSVPYEGRSPCYYDQFCIQGCAPLAKFSTLYVHVPKALATKKFDLRPNSHAIRLNTDRAGKKVESVTYIDAKGARRTQRARIFVLATNSYEVPRLLLLSANSKHPHGLANSSDQVGRNLMFHPSPWYLARFKEITDFDKGYPIGNIMTLDFYGTKRENPFIRGFSLQDFHLTPVLLTITHFVPFWGKRLKEVMREYRRLAGIFPLGDGLPVPTNRVTLSKEKKDRFGLPGGHIHYDWHSNDLKMVEAIKKKCEEILKAAGAEEIYPPGIISEIHAMGSFRMGNDPARSVANSYGQTHDVPNLFLGGAGLFVTGGALNPTLTLSALAYRTSEYIVKEHKAFT